MLPSLSIVIPCQSRVDLLRACLLSVTRHAPAGTQILVVDDGSPNGQASEVAAEFQQVHAQRFDRRQGFCVAANAGIHAATGDVVELLNDDTEVMQGWAEAALARFADPRIGAVAPLVLLHQVRAYDSAVLIDSAGDSYHRGGFARKRGHRRRLSIDHLQPCRVFGASGSSGFFRRDALLKVGCLPESFGAYFDDVDLAFRLRWTGYHTAFEPSSRVRHHGSATHGRVGRQLLEQQSRNEERVYWRNLPTSQLLRSLPLHAAVLAGKAWLRWNDGNLLPFLTGRLKVIPELQEIRRHRRWLRELAAHESPVILASENSM